MREDERDTGAGGGKALGGAEPEFLALDPQMEARLRARRAAARQRRAGTAATAGAQEKALRRWGPYELQEELGEGPAAVVWLARSSAASQVAVKLLRTAAIAGSEITRVRAANALRVGPQLAAVEHPALVRVHGVEQHDGRVGVVMEVVAGRTLAARLRDQGPLPVGQVLTLGTQMCRALEALHDSGLLHLGVTSRNVMLRDDGQALLMDVATVRKVAAGAGDRDVALSGAPQYLAPEWMRGDVPTAAADVYALGVTLYHAVTGRFPVKGPRVRDLRAAHARGETVPLARARPQVPAALAAAIDRAVALDPAQRFSSAAALRQALQAAAEAAQQAEASERSNVRARWAALPAALRALVGAAAVAALILLMWLASR